MVVLKNDDVMVDPKFEDVFMIIVAVIAMTCLYPSNEVVVIENILENSWPG